MDIRHAVIIGAGLSGRAATRLLRAHQIPVRLIERSPERIPEAFLSWAMANDVELIKGEHRPEHFTDVDTVIPSPAAAMSSIIPLLPERNPPTILAETELAWRELDGEKVVSVTGTSGKTTTTSLISAMLKAHGLRVFTGGNIGTPLSEYILGRRNDADKADVVVLELSSFQLQTCHDFRPDVGLLLNISENHLDFHRDMEEYIAAKMNMFLRQTPKDTAILAEDLIPLYGRYGLTGRLVRFDPDFSRFTRMRLLGPHNRANAEAAYLVAAEMGVTETTAMRAAAEFPPIENRLEIVGELNGVLYVNDSKATTVEALRVALNAFERPVLLLAGGKFKGGDLNGIRPLLKTKVRHIALYGGAREHFEQAWHDIAPISYDTALEQAVIRLAGLAREGDAVLLSPATASFDQYASYIARGQDFRRIVKEVLV